MGGQPGEAAWDAAGLETVAANRQPELRRHSPPARCQTPARIAAETRSCAWLCSWPRAQQLRKRRCGEAVPVNPKTHGQVGTGRGRGLVLIVNTQSAPSSQTPLQSRLPRAPRGERLAPPPAEPGAIPGPGSAGAHGQPRRPPCSRLTSPAPPGWETPMAPPKAAATPNPRQKTRRASEQGPSRLSAAAFPVLPPLPSGPQRTRGASARREARGQGEGR